MSKYSIYDKPSYAVEVPPAVIGKKNMLKRVSLSTESIVSAINGLIGQGIIDIVPISQARSACFKVETEAGDRFIKVFYSKVSPLKTYKLIQKVCALGDGSYYTAVAKLSRRVYASVAPFALGKPLIDIGLNFSFEKQVEAGKAIGEKLKDIRAEVCYSDYGIKTLTAKKALRKIYINLKLRREKSEKVWRLYKFAKANIKVLDGKTVLCHGDMHANNVMCDLDNGVYSLIDYDALVVSHSYLDIAPFSFLPKRYSAFIKSVVTTVFDTTGVEFWIKHAVSATLYALEYMKFNKGFINTALEILDSEGLVPFWN